MELEYQGGFLRVFLLKRNAKHINKEEDTLESSIQDTEASI